MLDKLSDSELEKCELNLEAYMNETVMIFEKRRNTGGILKDLDLENSNSELISRLQDKDRDCSGLLSIRSENKDRENGV